MGIGYEDRLGGPLGDRCGFVGHGAGLERDERTVLGPLALQIMTKMTIHPGAEDDISGRGCCWDRRYVPYDCELGAETERGENRGNKLHEEKGFRTVWIDISC